MPLFSVLAWLILSVTPLLSSATPTWYYGANPPDMSHIGQSDSAPTRPDFDQTLPARSPTRPPAAVVAVAAGKPLAAVAAPIVAGGHHHVDIKALSTSLLTTMSHATVPNLPFNSSSCTISARVGCLVKLVTSTGLCGLSILGEVTPTSCFLGLQTLMHDSGCGKCGQEVICQGLNWARRSHLKRAKAARRARRLRGHPALKAPPHGLNLPHLPGAPANPPPVDVVEDREPASWEAENAPPESKSPAAPSVSASGPTTGPPAPPASSPVPPAQAPAPPAWTPPPPVPPPFAPPAALHVTAALPPPPPPVLAPIIAGPALFARNLPVIPDEPAEVTDLEILFNLMGEGQKSSRLHKRGWLDDVCVS